MEKSVEQGADEAFKALFEMFSDPRVPKRAHFKCPIDDPPDEFDEAFESAMTELLGPNVEYKRWVERLRKLGLIGW